MLDLMLRPEAAKLIGLDIRTLSKRPILYPPIGIIEINRRQFPVYDRAELEMLRNLHTAAGILKTSNE
jgi:hypothetical protein